MKYLKTNFLLMCVVLSCGCSANMFVPDRTPSDDEIVSADYGEEPQNVTSLIAGSSNLKDPLSAMVRLHSFSRGYSSFGNDVKYGWCAIYDINAKNSFGGYTGSHTESKLFFWDNGVLKNFVFNSGCKPIPERLNDSIDNKLDQKEGNIPPVVVKDGTLSLIEKNQMAFVKLSGFSSMMMPIQNTFFKGQLEDGSTVVLISVQDMTKVVQSKFSQILITKKDYSILKNIVNKFYKWENIAKSNHDTVEKLIATIDTRVSFIGSTSTDINSMKRKKVSGKTTYTFVTESVAYALKPEDKTKYLLKVEQKGKSTDGLVYYDHDNLKQLISNLDELFGESSSNKKYDKYQ